MNEHLGISSGLENTMVIGPSTFVVEYRVSNKPSPRRDISWRAHGLGGETKPVWTIDLAFV